MQFHIRINLKDYKRDAISTQISVMSHEVAVWKLGVGVQRMTSELIFFFLSFD